MNVTIFEFLDDGGIAHYAYNLAVALAEMGLNVVLYTTKNFEFKNANKQIDIQQRFFRISSLVLLALPSLNREYGIYSMSRRFIKLIEYPFNAVEALIYLKKNHVDIVHFQSINEIELFFIMLLKIFGIKIVYTIHNVNPRHGKFRFYNFIAYKLIYKLCDSLIIHTHEGQKEISRLFKIDLNKISVIPHGDYKFFVPSRSFDSHRIKDKLNISCNTKAILFFGAIRPNKGLDVILRALPIVAEEINRVKLIIAGEPCENYNRYRNLIVDLEIQNHIVEHLGYISNQDVASYFIAADLVVLPYKEVSGSGVLQIAYAFGKPVVASDLPGFEEVIDSGKNGLLALPQNPTDFAQKLLTVLNNNKLQQSMGDYSRYLSESKFSWNEIAQKTIELYSSI